MYLIGKIQTNSHIQTKFKQLIDPFLFKHKAAFSFAHDTLPFIFHSNAASKWPLGVAIVTCIKRSEIQERFSTDWLAGPASVHLLLLWGKLDSVFVATTALISFWFDFSLLPSNKSRFHSLSLVYSLKSHQSHLPPPAGPGFQWHACLACWQAAPLPLCVCPRCSIKILIS